jgi:hypothetical protein
MTRAEVLALINQNIATGSNITAAKHKAVEIALLDFIPSVKSSVAYGRIGPIDIADATTSWSVNGDLYSATRVGSVQGKYIQIRVTIPSGRLTSTDFKVRTDVESASASPNLDNDMLGVLFRKDGSSTTTFDILLEEITAQSTTIYIHVEVIQL